MAIVQAKRSRSKGQSKGIVAFFLLCLIGLIGLAHRSVDEQITSPLLHFESPSKAAPSIDARWGNDRWKPIDCNFFIKEVQQGRIVNDPNNGQLMAIYTQEHAVPFWINVHSGKYDQPRLAVFETGVYYERALTAVFSQILAEAPSNARVVDVGGNIGWFSMLSAAHGHHVDVFEPNHVNVLRQCQSKWLNGWPTATEQDILSRTKKKSSINIRAYGVSDQEKETGTLFFGNPGMGSFVNTKEFIPAKNVTQVSDIPMIMLDSMATELGWFDHPIHIAILKIDIEGFEPPTVKGALKLLASGMVDNVLMEMTSRWDNEENEQMLMSLVETGFSLYMIGKSSGPTSRDVPSTDIDLPKKIIERCASRPRQQCNFWWKYSGVSKSLRNS